MAKKPRAGHSYKTQYKAYTVKGQWRKNKLAGLERRVLNNENDSSALTLFEKSSKTYGRSKPGMKGWFHPQEQKLLRLLKDEPGNQETKAKLASLRDVYSDTRPTAIQNAKPAEQPTQVVDQLLEIGVINEKRRKSFKTRYRPIRKR